MANTDRARKLLVRTALVTSATIATLVGAQNLAMLDSRQIEELLTPTADPTTLVQTNTTSVAAPTLTVQPTVETRHAAPSIIILRRPGDSGSLQTTSIQPPAPVELGVPDPVIVQGEAPPPIIIQQSSSPSFRTAPSSTRSSR